MVTTAHHANTIAFPTPRRVSSRKRAIHAEQHTELRLQLSNLLQTSLELSQVLQLFFDEVQDNLTIGSLSYKNEKISDDINIGKHAVHSCHYQLTTNNDSFGELTFTRSKRFAEKELQLLEMLIGCLILPIRNALTYRQAIQSALQDTLTGVGNRLALENNLERDIARARRQKQPLSVLIVDIDKFKRVNDNHGHSAGDHVLKAVAQQMTLCCRDADSTYHTYRYGGEEFVILLNNTSAKGSAIVAERLRKSIEAMTSSYDDNTIDVTVSIGVTSLLKDDSLSTLFSRADKALYQAKNNGRNQVITK